ncbi:hypothetical protein [Halopiger xanaduensis]|uniref:hypothetical protein n=1 Tax=Halopiger xanaduensis TaxID=387343 RepID=UPI0011D1B3D0|nr:hypothetical protein [Halopiger xanaduensis]
MQSTDLPSLLKEEVEILYLYVPVVFGYLYHLEGELQYLIVGILSMIFPAMDIAHSYYLNGRMFLGNSMDPTKLAALYMISLLIYVPSHIYGMSELFSVLNHNNLISTVLFFVGSFLTILATFSWLLFKWTIKPPKDLHAVPSDLQEPLLELREGMKDIQLSDLEEVPENLRKPIEDLYRSLDDVE